MRRSLEGAGCRGAYKGTPRDGLCGNTSDFLRADAQIQPDGTVTPRTFWMDAMRAGAGIYRIDESEWHHFLHRITQPVTLIQAAEPFAFGQFIVEESDAMRTAAILPQCTHLRVPGNHVTMLYGEGAGHCGCADGACAGGGGSGAGAGDSGRVIVVRSWYR